MQTIQPAEHQLFCKPDDKENKTQSGFILTEKAVERSRFATVVNIGSEVKNYHQNDRIVYKSYATTEVKVNDEDYFLIADEDILGKVLEVDGTESR